MAEEIPYSIANNVWMKLGSLISRGFGLRYGVERELVTLREKLSTMKDLVVDSQQWQLSMLRGWFKRVVYMVDDMLDDLEAEDSQRTADAQGGIGKQISCFFSSSNLFLFRFAIRFRLEKFIEQIDLISKDNLFRHSIHGSMTGDMVGRQSPTVPSVNQLEIVGRDEKKEEIIGFLMQPGNDENLSIVGIVGIAGIGKTALAQLVVNDERVERHFEVMIWVYFSYQFDHAKVTPGFYVNQETMGIDKLGALFHKKLTGKRFLVVLDNVWNVDIAKWHRLRLCMMGGANGSKVIVTTRNLRVASIMGINSPYVLGGLQGDESCVVFLIRLLKNIRVVSPNLVEISAGIVNMCHGVPLLIERLAMQFWFITEESEWLSIINNRNLMSVVQKDIFSSLKLSYDNLPNHLKQPFGYCALFPKDYRFEKKMMVQLWMAQGYLQPSNENQNLEEDIGDLYFEDLLTRLLFEEVETDGCNNTVSCKMHNLVHDLAKSVVGPEILILTDDVGEISEGVHHLPVFQPLSPVHHVSVFQPLSCGVVELLKEKYLRTLFVHSNYGLKDDAIANIIISSCKDLRVLQLNALVDKMVPESIVKLSRLSYLDLSYNDFEVLPSAITRLQSLQTLRLLRCGRLKELPGDIGKLVNLRHLEIDGCESLAYMPSGLGQLTMLQSLPLFVVGNGSVPHGRLSELNGLKHLRGEIRIKNLERLRGHMALESMEANLKGKLCLQSLRLEWQPCGETKDKDAELAMEGLQPNRHLKGLYIKGYGANRFPSWMMHSDLGSLLPNLMRIEMQNCEGCKVLPPFGQLPHLQYLELEDLTTLEYMQESSPEMPFFPTLKILRLHKLHNLKGWSKDGSAEEGPSFSCLSKLFLSNCHCLRSLPLLSSPSLFQVEIHNCGSLTSLHLCPSPCLSKLDIRDCQNLTSLALSSSPRLAKLHISGCHNLISFVLPSSPHLSELYISGCPSLTSLQLNSSPCNSKLHICDSPNLACSELPSFPCLEEVHLSYVSEKLLRQLMFISSVLKCLKIQWVANLISLPEDGLQHLTSLQHLVIHGCHSLVSLSQVIQHLTALEKLEILHCGRLLLSDKDADADGGLQFQGLGSLRELVIKDIPKLVSLPKRLQHVTMLKTLTICDCSGLATLPNWIGSLISLAQLHISDCPKLKSLPEEMCLLNTLQQLEINNCPRLLKRCQVETGEDWPKISHVPKIVLDGQWMTSSYGIHSLSL